MSKKRHFIVFFKCEKNRVGHMIFVSNDGSYLNMYVVIEVIKDENIKDPVITNIIELTESDYIDWTAKLETT